MKLSEKYPYREMYEKACLRNFILHVSSCCYHLNLPEKIISDARICESGSLNLMQAGGNDAKFKTRLSKSSPFEVKMLVEFIRHGISSNVISENVAQNCA
jgi:hypothetical protein